MKYHFVQFAVLLMLLAPLFARAGGDEVVVVYNKKMPESKAVADYYAQMRHVPQKQVFGFSLPTDEVMSREEFSDSLQFPLARKLESSGLWKFGEIKLRSTNHLSPRTIHCVVASKIRYLVLCYGTPLKITNDPDLDELQNPAIPALFQNNGASVDSELAWLPMVENKMRLTGPMNNWTYGATNAASLSPTNGILLVTRLDGPSADIAMGLVKKSIEAEQNGLWGRAYFDARSITDPHYKVGDDWILTGAELCRQLGFDTIVDKNPETFPADFPMSQIAIYAGWYDGNADGPFAQPTVEFMPGAFAYHLHSYSANTLRSTTLNWCGPLLAKGATCTMGCVDEPSIQFTPNIAVFLGRWTIEHFTFAEAAWASESALSWQTTVIGDPLYCPFAKEPKELNAELAQTHNPLIEWSYLRLVNAAQARGASLAQLEDYLENLPVTDTSAVLTEKLAELCDAQGKPESAVEFYQRAFKLNPSPQQKIRIYLALAQESISQNDTSSAIVYYKQLLAEFPAYPGKDSISGKIAALQPKTAGAK
jgi:uncharacterized protein (TIGR03790 family)